MTRPESTSPRPDTGSTANVPPNLPNMQIVAGDACVKSGKGDGEIVVVQALTAPIKTREQTQLRIATADGRLIRDFMPRSTCANVTCSEPSHCPAPDADQEN